MLAFPNAKINLGLHVLRKRDDGYHDIETCLVPIPFTDILEIIPAQSFSFNSTGLAIDTSNEHNLCIKAYHLIRSEYNIGPIAMHLHKVIPMGAGLGGGSSDAAFTLKMLNDLFDIGISTIELKQLASQLGSDCPIFIDNNPAIATGTGTALDEISVDLKGKFLMLVFPTIGINTVQAYAHIHPELPEYSIRKVLKEPIANWKEKLVNRFEKSVFQQFPELEEIKKSLYDSGASYAAMSGSGSTLFGLFNENPNDIAFTQPGIAQKIIQLF